MPKRRRERSRTPPVQWESLPTEPASISQSAEAAAAARSRRAEAQTQASEPPSRSRESAAEPSGPAVDSEAAKSLETVAWRRMVAHLAYLRGDAKVEALLARKHPELADVAERCGATGKPTASLYEAKESCKDWFFRGLKGSNRQGPVQRADLCDKLTEQLRSHASSLRVAEAGRRAAELLAGRGPASEEGPLVCTIMAKELEGSKYTDLWISREGPNGAYILGDDHEGSGLPIFDQDGAPIDPRIRVIVKAVADGKLSIDGFYHSGEATLNPAKVAIGPFLSVYFEGVSLKEALNRWKDGPTGDAVRKPVPPPPVAATGSNGSAGSSSNPAVSSNSALAALQASLPAGWEIRESRSKKGVYYYANPAKGLSQMERPKA